MRTRSHDEARRTAVGRAGLRGVLAVVLMATGSTLMTSAPASAVGSCNGQSPVSACVDYGSYGNRSRLDFYMNVSPSAAYSTYKAWINVNGSWYLLGSGQLSRTGSYCCWYRNTDSEPNTWKTVYTEIDVYNSSGSYVLSSTSRAIRYLN